MYRLVDSLGTVLRTFVALTVRRPGDGLGVRIPAAGVRRARFSVGPAVAVAPQRMLAVFEPAAHAGEAMATAAVGRELP